MDAGRDRSTTPDTDAQAAPASRDRRRLLIAGITAAPFLLTLASRPALATGGGTLGTYTGDYGTVPPDDGTTDGGTTDGGTTSGGSKGKRH